MIDAANGMGGYMITPILERLPIVVERCHFEPDGSFPHYEPNPLLPESREFIVDRVRETGADLGIAFDGDGDRCFFIDDTGEFVPGDFITALIAELMLQREPGATIIYDVRASHAVPELVERMGGRAVPSRVGHAYIKHRIRQEGAIFAGEVSGHYYFRDFYGVDTGIVPALVVLELVSRAGGKLSELLAALQQGHHLSGEINSKVHGRAAEAAGAEGALRPERRRRARLAPRRADRRVRRLVVQRAPVEHRATASAQPRGAERARDGAPARRGARRDHGVT